MPNPVILDSVTRLQPVHRGAAAYCASHGGNYAAAYAAAQGIGALILNDAGIGRQQAGVAGLAVLDRLGVPAAAVSHRSARIGDGADGHARGKLSFVNQTARFLGLDVGMPCADALAALARHPLTPAPTGPPLTESRFVIADSSGGAIRVIGMDSTSLVTPADAGHIIVTASHGGLLGGNPATAVRYDVRAAVFNDAGFGIENAGISRLSALDARGIAGACVSCFSARIGDARSTYDDGFISAVNQSAARLGGTIGQSCAVFVAAMTLTK